MRIPHSHHTQRGFSVQMTPMIDVVFLLLIFFVCTASFQLPETILPSPLALDGTAQQQPNTPPEMELEHVLIRVARRGDTEVLTVNEQPCASLARLSQLLEALAQVEAALPVILDIGGEVSVGTAIDVYDRCRLAGFRKIQFAAEVP